MESQIIGLQIYPNNDISLNALIDLERSISGLSQNSVNEIRMLNNEIFNLISGMSLEYLYVSYTTSDSLFYRFKLNDTSHEFKWEVYLNSEDDSIESIIHVYKNSEKRKSTYGTVTSIYSDVIIPCIDSEKYVDSDYFQQAYGEISYALSA